MNEDGQQERTRCIPWTERRGGRETRKSGESSLPPRWSEREIRNERGRGKGRDGGRRQVGEGEREEKRRERKARAVRSSIFWVTLARSGQPPAAASTSGSTHLSPSGVVPFRGQSGGRRVNASTGGQRSGTTISVRSRASRSVGSLAENARQGWQKGRRSGGPVAGWAAGWVAGCRFSAETDTARRVLVRRAEWVAGWGRVQSRHPRL